MYCCLSSLLSLWWVSRCQEVCTGDKEKPSKTDEEQVKKVKVSYVPVRQKGLKVIARIDADGFYYPGLFTLLTGFYCRSY